MLRKSAVASLAIAVALVPVSVAYADPTGSQATVGLVPADVWSAFMGVLPYISLALLVWAAIATWLARSQYSKVREQQFEINHLRKLARNIARNSIAFPKDPIGHRGHSGAAVPKSVQRMSAARNVVAAGQARVAGLRQVPIPDPAQGSVAAAKRAAAHVPGQVSSAAASAQVAAPAEVRASVAAPAQAYTAQEPVSTQAPVVADSATMRSAASTWGASQDTQPFDSGHFSPIGGSFDFERTLSELEAEIGISEEHRMYKPAASATAASASTAASSTTAVAPNAFESQRDADAAKALASLDETPSAAKYASAADDSVLAKAIQEGKVIEITAERPALAYPQATASATQPQDGLGRHSAAGVFASAGDRAQVAQGASQADATAERPPVSTLNDADNAVQEPSAAPAGAMSAATATPPDPASASADYDDGEEMLAAVAGQEPGWYRAPKPPASVVADLLAELEG